MITIKLACVFIQLLTFVGYVVYTLKKYGISVSISDSFYNLQGKEKILFSLMTWGIALPLFAFVFDKGTELKEISWGFVATIILIGGIGVFTLCRDEFQRIPHLIFAFGGVGIALISVGIYFDMWWPLAIFALLALSLQKTKNKLYFIEIIAFTLIIISEILNIY